MKFKVGDKVRIVKNDSDSINEVGDVGTVVEILYERYKVQVDNRNNIDNYHEETDLELFEEKPRMEASYLSFDTEYKCEFNNNFPERVTREIEYGDFIFYITEGEELLQIKASYSDESIFIHPYEVDDICSILQQLKKY